MPDVTRYSPSKKLQFGINVPKSYWIDGPQCSSWITVVLALELFHGCHVFSYFVFIIAL